MESMKNIFVGFVILFWNLILKNIKIRKNDSENRLKSNYREIYREIYRDEFVETYN
jgi:hypothetical protein